MGTTWVVQIFGVTDAEVQELLAGLLAPVTTLAVETATNGSNHYLIVECGDAGEAQRVFAVVRSVDPAARLLHSSSSPAAAVTAA